MENIEASTENGTQHNNSDNIYVDLNNMELLETVRELRDELQTMKQDNQIILELNEYLLDKMNKQEKDKRSAIEIDSKTTSYKHKEKRVEYSNRKTSS